MESIETAIAAVGRAFSEKQLDVFEIQIARLAGSRLALRGRVLERSNLDALRAALPGMDLDLSGVKVLRAGRPVFRWVATNLTSLHAQPGWLAEQVSQLPFGVRLEVLEERERWALIRQDDGYLGWAYLPFTSPVEPPQPTHLAVEPVSPLMAEPRPDAKIVSRLLGGTPVAVDAVEGDWARVRMHLPGWVLVDELRGLDALPQSAAARRKQILADAQEYIGVPYLWGGCTANGIDCSGFAQLLYRMVGISLPRDAHMQYRAGRAVEGPFQPGDLVFFGEDNDRQSISHVTVSMGGWKIIHSSRSHNGVAIDEDLREVPHLRDSLTGGAAFID
ncbi:cell wall-associated hydrolase [Longilinea arvoryzae]|uniref:Cell wall-associated hydrolase n=1 Tax=Longilinea arvoryzae TaxID=360412 RepID=A0A0S7BB74_9CHLR|nr:NlpC/P60 family protein [Longilinea arvoryzae]GAP12297.1 cell wall-associated hydrolase [Longilinea arvoryzae]